MYILFIFRIVVSDEEMKIFMPQIMFIWFLFHVSKVKMEL